MTGERNKTLDLAKGAAILLVLWGHFIQYSSSGTYDYYDDKVFTVIYSFHMPLFALISGYLLFDSIQKRNLVENLKRKILSIGTPLIIWTTIQYFCQKMLEYILTGQYTGSIYGWWTHFTGMYLWFLWSILASSIVVIIVMKYVKSRLLWGGLIIAFPILYIFPNPDMNLFIYPYVVIGLFFKKYEYFFRRHYRYAVAVIPMYILMLLFYNRKCYIYTTGISFSGVVPVIEQIQIDVFRYIVGLFGSISAVVILKMLESIVPEKYFALGEKCGQFSLQIYILQCLFVTWLYPRVFNLCINRFGVDILYCNAVLYDIAMLILALIFLAILEFMGNLLCKNKKIAVLLFGR